MFSTQYSVQFLPFEKSDLAFVPGLQPDGWPDILPFLTWYTQAPFCHPLKVMAGEQVAGIGTWIKHQKVAWLAHIIVHPNHRSQGLGTAITKKLVEEASKHCSTIYLVATELGERIYARAGFEQEAEYLFFKDLKADPKPQADYHIVPYQAAFKEQLAQIDRAACGEDRFFHLEMFLADAMVYLGDDEWVYGFYLPMLGEGLVVAVEDKAGLALMKYRLHTHNHAVFPANNLVATQWLYSGGATEIRRAKKMRLLQPRENRLAMIYNRIAGNLG